MHKKRRKYWYVERTLQPNIFTEGKRSGNVETTFWIRISETGLTSSEYPSESDTARRIACV